MHMYLLRKMQNQGNINQTKDKMRLFIRSEMSRRQLKKISGYDETAELMKAMGVDASDLESTSASKPAKSR